MRDSQPDAAAVHRQSLVIQKQAVLTYLLSWPSCYATRLAIQICCPAVWFCITGKAGSTSLRLSFLDPTGLVAWQCHTQSTAAAAAGPGTGSLLLLVSQSKRNWRGIQTHINNAVHGVMQVGNLAAEVLAASAATGAQATGLQQCRGACILLRNAQRLLLS